MAIHEDVEGGTGSGVQQGDLAQPLIPAGNKISCESPGKGSIWVVLLSTFVAVCGAFEFGSCVGYSAPTQAAIVKELDLSLAEH
ncbi:hypothetical protein ACLOJK_025126 [Asimina triloba]